MLQLSQSYVRTHHSLVESLKMDAAGCLSTETEPVWQDQDDLLMEISEP